MLHHSNLLLLNRAFPSIRSSQINADFQDLDTSPSVRHTAAKTAELKIPHVATNTPIWLRCLFSLRLLKDGNTSRIEPKIMVAARLCRTHTLPPSLCSQPLSCASKVEVRASAKTQCAGPLPCCPHIECFSNLLDHSVFGIRSFRRLLQLNIAFNSLDSKPPASSMTHCAREKAVQRIEDFVDRVC